MYSDVQLKLVCCPPWTLVLSSWYRYRYNINTRMGTKVKDDIIHAKANNSPLPEEPEVRSRHRDQRRIK